MGIYSCCARAQQSEWVFAVCTKAGAGLRLSPLSVVDSLCCLTWNLSPPFTLVSNIDAVRQNVTKKSSAAQTAEEKFWGHFYANLLAYRKRPCIAAGAVARIDGHDGLVLLARRHIVGHIIRSRSGIFNQHSIGDRTYRLFDSCPAVTVFFLKLNVVDTDCHAASCVDSVVNL